MRTRSLVLIALRLYAIYWLFQSLSGLVTVVPMLLMMEPQVQGRISWTLAIVPVVMLIFSAALWFSATPLSAAVARGHDAELSIAPLTREDLYCFAFVFIGLYFALASISGVVDAGYKFLTQDALLSESDPRHGRELIPFLGHALTLIIGFGCVLGAAKWSRILVKKE
jgi:hypothetical protein